MKKKILFINGHLNAGGVEKSLVDILRNMDYDKYDVDLLLFEDLGDYADDLPQQVNVRLVDLHNSYGSLPKALLRCMRSRDWFCFKYRILTFLQKYGNVSNLKHLRKTLFGNIKYDAVIGFRPGICTNIAAFAVDAEKRITWWHHGEYNLCGKFEEDYLLACKQMDTIVSVSAGCAEFLRENLPDIADKIQVIPNLLDGTAITEKANLFNPYAEDDGQYRIVSVGRLSPEKHIENAILAAKALIDDGITDFRWYIVGDGSERQKLEQLAEEYGLRDRVIFVGSQPNPYPYMKHADLFVHPSYVESQGLVVLEAMTLGVPCVVTKSLGPSEFIEDGVNGLLTEQSAESLAEKVLGLMSNINMKYILRENTRCPKQFIPDTIMKKIDCLLNCDVKL